MQLRDGASPCRPDGGASWHLIEAGATTRADHAGSLNVGRARWPGIAAIDGAASG
jgi:hypothetical protein